ncbi:hypothetical protein ACQCSX_04190 [Pseudarthrobacter sp. P1]|uniref:hypothetical protein n=1 Tax=Pseudarthrobacter sp. P1 TaxID=3418418 RepID=UPI003CF9E747
MTATQLTHFPDRLDSCSDLRPSATEAANILAAHLPRVVADSPAGDDLGQARRELSAATHRDLNKDRFEAAAEYGEFLRNSRDGEHWGFRGPAEAVDHYEDMLRAAILTLVDALPDRDAL